MNTTLKDTSAIRQGTDHGNDGTPLERVKEKLLDEARDAGDREATVANKDVQWGLHLRILAEIGVTMTTEANRTLVKEALHIYREMPHRITGQNKKKSSVLTHAVQAGDPRLPRPWRESGDEIFAHDPLRWATLSAVICDLLFGDLLGIAPIWDSQPQNRGHWLRGTDDSVTNYEEPWGSGGTYIWPNRLTNRYFN